MSKEGFFDGFFRMNALIGGAWIPAEILKVLAKKVYRCPNCNRIVQKDAFQCFSCGVKLIWKI